MTHIEITPTKTYKTAANAHAAVQKKFSHVVERQHSGAIRYIVTQHSDGRFYPLFIGLNNCNYGVHFHFNVVN
jgi:hypothetical protein